MSARNADLARIHILKKELGFDDDTYRDVLERVTGVRSSAKLDAAARGQLLAELRRLSGKSSGFSKAPKAYVRKIWAVWAELKRDGIWREADRQSLVNFVEKMTGKKSPDWLTYSEASTVIEALKNMGARA